jgi:hypothetical protein
MTAEVQPEVLDQGLRANGKLYAWTDLEKLVPGPVDRISLSFRKGEHGGRSRIPVSLDAKAMPEFLDSLFKAWVKRDRGAAQKAAFDYSSSKKTAGWLWIILSLAFPGLLSVILLLDAFQTKHCTPLLEQGLAVPAQITKVTKDRRGNWIWLLRFQAQTGETITGKRAAFEFDEKGNAKNPPTVVYSPQDLKCWDLSLESGKAVVNTRQRQFFMTFEFSFGWAFAALAAIGVFAGIWRLRKRIPYRETVERISAELLR